MSLIGTYVLGTSLAIQPAPVDNSNAREEAVRAIGKALYKELDLDEPVKRLEKKLITKEIRENGKWIVIISKIAIEKRISYEWTF